MKKIYKYELKTTDEQIIMLPKHAEILSAHEQDGVLCLWAKVDPSDHRLNKIKIFVIGTGNPMPEACEDAAFLGTVIMYPFVWHVFSAGRQ